MKKKFSRRSLIRALGLGSSAGVFTRFRPAFASGDLKPRDTWYRGDIIHILPTASHDRVLLKISLVKPPVSPPLLHIDGKKIPGEQSDSHGYFWQFHVAGLKSSTSYSLQLKDRANYPLCDSWPLSTLPHPDADIDKLRILAYTCAGGDESMVQSNGERLFLTLEDRRRLLHRGLSLKPDIVIANGDHIYYDQRTMLANKPAEIIAMHRALFDELGMLDRDKPILGTENETVIKKVGDRQIAHLYGVSLRSTPVFMLTDDHDLFENDEATEDLITLPPDRTMLAAARAIQHLYYPEFLPDENRPVDLPGGVTKGPNRGCSESFGTLRYGRLFEALMYDAKRYVSVNGQHAHMIPQEVETWLKSRTAGSDTAHLVHVPSTPIGWSAGKWGEWYPDVLGRDGKLGLEPSKPFWPEGWWQQHQRLLAVIAGQPRRIPLIISGDLHMFSAGKITRSGKLDFRNNPIYSLVVGPLGSGTPTFPSTARGTLAQVPVDMTMEQLFPPLEKNGFSIIDVQRKAMAVRMYAWRSPEAATNIDRLQPRTTIQLDRDS